MDNLSNIIRKISLVAAIIGGIFLSILMILTVVNVSARAVGGIIIGTHELSQLIIVVVASGSFAYATIEGRHVVMGVVVNRLSKFPRGILLVITSVISLVIIGLMVWANIVVLQSRWFIEFSDMLDIPFLPFRFVFVIGISLYCLVLLLEIYNGIRMVRKK